MNVIVLLGAMRMQLMPEQYVQSLCISALAFENAQNIKGENSNMKGSKERPCNHAYRGI